MPRRLRTLVTAHPHGPAPQGLVRVHVLIDTFRSGGAELLLADFAEVAAGAGIELSVAGLKPITPPSPAADRLRRRGFPPAAVPVSRMIDPRDLARVRAHLAAVRPAIVHTHLTTADFIGGIAARSLRIPSVATIHADWYSSRSADRARTWLASQVRQRCAAAVIAVSESARRAYLVAGRDVPDHVTVVRNGIVDRARAGSGAQVRRELGLGEQELVVTALSKLRPEKNFDVAIGAVGKLRARFAGLRLVIAGDGPHEEAVRRQAEPFGSTVVLAGHREDPMEILDASDVVIHPSHFDAFPTTLLEAMAASVPVVATAVGGIPEIVQNSVTGTLVGPPPTAEAFAVALAPLLESAETRVRMGAAGRARYTSEFRADAWALRLRAVYDELLTRAGARGRATRSTSGSR